MHINKLNTTGLRIIVFYIIAIVFSIYFRLAPPDWYDKLDLPYGFSMFKELLGGMGPFLGALIVTRLFKLQRKTVLHGTSKTKSWLMAIIPVLLFTIVGAANSENINPHLFGFLLGLLIIIYCILEETGWRGYLQDELRNLNWIVKYLLIGFLWYAWHLTFIGGHLNIKGELIILVILILASAGIGEAVKHTRSIMVAACLHSIGNILVFSSLIKTSIPWHNRLAIAGISIFVWIFILIFWDKKFSTRKK